MACGGEVTKLIVDLEDRMEKKFVLMGTESRTTLIQMLGEQRVRMDKEDSWVWKDKESTVLTVKSVYNFLKQGVQGGKEGDVLGFLEAEGTTTFSSHILEGLGR